MFRITQDPPSWSIDSYLIKSTRNCSTVLFVWAVGIWRHIQDLWYVCALRRIAARCVEYTTQRAFSSFHRASLLSVTFISRLVRSNLDVVDIKTCVI
jgi:hypothetical protein